MATTTDIINEMKTNIAAAYTAVEAKGGTVPANKNLANLAAAVESISGGGGIEEVSTVEALKAKNTTANVGKLYKYTGSNTSALTYNSIYQIISNGAKELVSTDVNLTITYGLIGCYASDTSGGTSDAPDSIALLSSAAIYITSRSGYTLPDSITVSGAEYEYEKSSDTEATLTLYDGTQDINISIKASNEFIVPSINSEDEIANYFSKCGVENVKDLSGFIGLIVAAAKKLSDRWEGFIKLLSITSQLAKNGNWEVYNSTATLTMASLYGKKFGVPAAFAYLGGYTDIDGTDYIKSGDMKVDSTSEDSSKLLITFNSGVLKSCQFAWIVTDPDKITVAEAALD